MNYKQLRKGSRLWWLLSRNLI